MKKDYSKLKELLEAQEKFPLRFTYKFIGRNTPAFASSVTRFERSFPGLRHEQSRESSGGQHLAKTYALEAKDSNEIIEIYRAIETLEDLMIIL